MIAILLSVSSCGFCKQTILIVRNIPETFEGPLGDGDRLCINSTLPYLAVAFQPTTFLKVRYYSLEPTSSLVKTSGHFYIPSEIAAIGFGHTIAHVEVQALIPGILSLSTFAFPSECSHSRYLTTKEDDAFHLANRLGLGHFADATPTAACIWSPHPSTAMSGLVSPDSRDSIQVCGNLGCRFPWANETNGRQATILFQSTEYLRIDGDRPDFVADFQVELSTKRRSNFLDAEGKLDNDAEVDTVTLAPRPAREKHPDVDDEVQPQANVAPPPAKAGEGRVPGVSAPAKRSKGPGLRTILNILEIVCLTVVILGALVCTMGVVVMRRSNADDSEKGLLGNAGPQTGGSRFAAILPHAVPWAPQYGVYQPPAGFVYPFPGGGGGGGGPSGFPAAQFPQAVEVPVQPQVVEVTAQPQAANA